MLSPMRWLLRSVKSLSKTRRVVKRASLNIVEDLETRQLLTTIFSEGFEGAFPGSDWTANVDSGRRWDDTDDKHHTGSWSGFCADLDAGGVDQTSYLNNLDTNFTRTVDLSDYRNVTLDYWRFINTESGYDTFTVTVSKAGVGSVSSTVLSGSLQSWTHDTLQIPESLWGQSGVTVSFKFHSDGTVIQPGTAGVWVDDISMDGILDDGFPESTINTPTGVNLPLNQFGNLTNYTNSIDSANDLDIYGIGVDTAGTYTITVSGAVDVQLRLYDANGNALTGIIDNSNAGGTESYVLNRPSSGQGFYLQVAGYKNSTGSYSINVNGPSSTPQQESTPSPTYSVTDNSTLSFAGDRDYYSFTAPLDTTTLSINLDPDAGLDIVLSLYNSSGTLLQKVDSGFAGTAENLSNYAITAGQTYVLMVQGYAMAEGATVSEGYTFTANFNPDNEGDPPSQITVPTGINLRLNQFGDVDAVAGTISTALEYDVFGFQAETSGNHTITLAGPLDGQLRIYDGNGNAVTALKDANGANTPESLTFNMTAGQTYYIGVGGDVGLTGNYNLSVAGPSATPSQVNLSAPNFFNSGSGSISGAGDRDYLAFTVPVGTNVLNINMNPSAALDAVFVLYDGAGNQVAFRDNGGTGTSEALTNFAVTPGQNYVLMLTGYSMAEGSVSAESYSYSIDFGPDQNDINQPPEIPADQELLINENSALGTVVGAVIANDPNTTAPNNVLTYSLLSATPSNLFTINANTGVVTYVGPGGLNYENVSEYTLTVKVTDGGNLFTSQTVKVTVLDVNEAPSVTPNQSMQLLENSDAGTVVGTVLATDPDIQAPNNTLTYSIVSGNPSNPFAIDPTTGEITVVDQSALDFETTSQFVLQVKVTDGGNGNLSSTQSVTINLLDANDAPSIVGGQTFSLAENSAGGTSVGNVLASDPDGTAPNNVLSYSISGGNVNGAFAINSATGEITVANAAAIDFEANPTFVLNITVTDGASLSASQDVTINLTNVNEAPTLTGNPANNPSFVKNQSAISVFPAITVKDPDGDTELASITISVSLPTGKKNFDVLGFGGAGALGTVNDSVVNGKRQLTITLNAGVTSTQVENFLRGVTFATSKASLKTTTRLFQVSATDIHGAVSNLFSQTVNVKKKA